MPGYELINQLAEQSDSTELGGTLSHALADRLRVTCGETSRRIAEAADLGPRRALSGEPLGAPVDRDRSRTTRRYDRRLHVAVIRRLFGQLPCSVDIQTREAAEKHLAKLVTQFRPTRPSWPPLACATPRIKVPWWTAHLLRRRLPETPVRTASATTMPPMRGVKYRTASFEGDERGPYDPVPAASQPPTDSCARYFLP